MHTIDAESILERPQQLIQQLSLQAHPEGGYYRRCYQAPQSLTVDNSSSQQALELVSKGGKQHRFLQTAIYYLLNGQAFSAFHKIRSDECWFLGEHNSAVRIYEYHHGQLSSLLLDAQHPMHCISAGTWFAAELEQAQPQTPQKAA